MICRWVSRFVLDENNRKMSKSLGNGIDPKRVINGGENLKVGKDSVFNLSSSVCSKMYSDPSYANCICYYLERTSIWC